MEEVKMTLKEADRLSVMRQIDKKTLTVRQASQELELSVRQTKRLRKRYLLEGEKGLVSLRRGKTSPNRTNLELEKEIKALFRKEEYHGFGPTFMQEKLLERHGHSFSRETIRKWMIDEKAWESKPLRKKKVYQRRKRREQFGELLQGDGSRHAWFEDRGEECTLVLFIDDATGMLTAGKFVPAETTAAYQEVLREHLLKHGRPGALYVDRHSIFKTSGKTRCTIDKGTHFARVLKDLDIELICANSPQAKGRIERANGTLQDRLIKEMRLRKIDNMDDANKYLKEFFLDHNRRFGRVPASRKDAHRRLRKRDDLERIFARRSTRKLSKDLSFSYKGTLYQLTSKRSNRVRSSHVNLLEKEGYPLIVERDGREQTYIRWEEAPYASPRVLDTKELEAYWTKLPQKPGKRHPWR